MVVFLGVAGSGKSVQGRMLADEIGLPWLSTGEFLRMLISGQRRKDMLTGKLLDDREIISLVRKVLSLIDIDEEFIIDGFPRTANQAEWLLSQVKHEQLAVTAVIHLQASREVVETRLLERGRQDDNKEAIAARFAEYEASTKPIIEQFEAAGVDVIKIDAEQSIELVNKEVTSAIKSRI